MKCQLQRTYFVGTPITVFLLLITWVILSAHTLLYKESSNAGIALLTIGFGVVGVVSVLTFGFEATIVLIIYSVIISLALTNKSIHYLARDQKT